MEPNKLLNTEPNHKKTPDSSVAAGELAWLTIDQWQAYVEGHARASIFHHRNWLELLHEEYGFEIRIPAIVDGGQIRAAIPFLQTRSLRMKKKLISLPFTDYLQILADDQQGLATLCHLIGSAFSGKSRIPS